ncbi:MAG: neutral/alkaline non-lysosomal ceramidase N-terminal domain-containing protein [Candidatus Poribacteria bacterium]|nr:neutral/alkaline non-lysosomal ceramidase N-terminal domain-containing protein [Candidatus Poribacteria bacterium]
MIEKETEEMLTNRVFQAGAATADITPPLGELVVGGFIPFPATAIHDQLQSRCLVLDNGQTQIAFVICDNLGISREVYDRARLIIAQETELPVENILMAATHTHSATRVQTDNYRPQIVRGIADSVRLAVDNLKPAQIGWGRIDEPSEVFNRRWHVTDSSLLKNPFGGIDQVRMNPPRDHAALIEPAGPTDPEVSFLSLQATNGCPIALLANYSLHYVGGVNKGDVSADYFGIFCNRIAELLGATSTQPLFVGMLSNGTSGDVNNIDFRDSGEKYEPYEKMNQVAELVAKRVKEAHDQIKLYDWVPLSSVVRELKLQFLKPDEIMQKYMGEVLAKSKTSPQYHQYERYYAERIQRLLTGPDEVTVPLQAVRVGEVGIAAIPFEVFAETGLEIKDRTPFTHAFTIELANDYHGYLPTPNQHELGGYETWMGTSKVQLDASELIKHTILDMMNNLK